MEYTDDRTNKNRAAVIVRVRRVRVFSDICRRRAKGSVKQNDVFTRTWVCGYHRWRRGNLQRSNLVVTLGSWWNRIFQERETYERNWPPLFLDPYPVPGPIHLIWYFYDNRNYNVCLYRTYFKTCSRLTLLNSWRSIARKIKRRDIVCHL